MERGNRLILRSTPEEEMTPENALAVGTHVGALYRRVVVGIDSSPNSGMIQAAFMAGLVSAGANTVEAGVAPAPAVCLVFKNSCDCIAMVGSPNEYGSFSSIELFNPDGSRFGTEQLSQILEVAEAPLPDYQEVGQIRRDHGANTRYLEKLTLSGLKADGYVIADCGGGSVSLCAPAALAAAGADVASINANVDGRHVPRSPGLNRADLTGIADFVNASVGSIGIAYNGNGTRLAVIDESGRVVAGDHILALMLLFLHPKVAVVPFDSPGLIDYVSKRNLSGKVDEDPTHPQRRLIRVNGTLDDITTAIRQNHADLGALNDGTFIFPDYSLCPDAIRASAVISQLAGSQSIRNLLESFPPFYSDSEQFHYGGNPDLFGKNFLQKLREYDIDEILVVGSWRVQLKHGSYLVSASADTVTVRGESTDQTYLTTMMEQAKEIVRSCL